MHRTTFLVMATCLGLSSAARAQSPRVIPFQFHLADAAGKAITVPVSVRFSLYPAATGGVAVWTESKAVTPVNGTAETMLGDATPFNAVPPGVSFNVPYYLGVKVGNDAEMQPRLPLGAVPYAMGLPNVTVDMYGRVGIGMDAPKAALQVAGDIALGGTQTVTAVGGEESLRIIRGKVSYSGAIMAGSGFTVTRPDGVGSGGYRIQFNSAFPELPTVVGSTAAYGQGSAVTEGVSSGYCAIRTYVGAAAADKTFDFIAVGPRY